MTACIPIIYVLYNVLIDCSHCACTLKSIICTLLHSMNYILL